MFLGVCRGDGTEPIMLDYCHSGISHNIRKIPTSPICRSPRPTMVMIISTIGTSKCQSRWQKLHSWGLLERRCEQPDISALLLLPSTTATIHWVIPGSCPTMWLPYHPVSSAAQQKVSCWKETGKKSLFSSTPEYSIFGYKMLKTPANILQWDCHSVNLLSAHCGSSTQSVHSPCLTKAVPKASSPLAALSGKAHQVLCICVPVWPKLEAVDQPERRQEEHERREQSRALGKLLWIKKEGR